MLIDSNMVISGFVSKIANDCVDILKDKIKDADRNRKADEQNIETRIYQVTIDALNEFPYNQYKKEEKVYDAAESILKGFKGNQDDKVEAVRVGLKMLVPQVTSETCMDFLKILHHEICIDKNDILYKEIILLQGEQTFESVCEGFDVSNKNDEETHEKLDQVIEGIKNIDKKIDGIEYDETKHYEIPIKNRAEEYADKWEKNVFLNNFNKRDKNAGVNIKLKEIYLEEHLPHYVWKMGDEPLNDLKDLLNEYTGDNTDKKMLLILGQAGIGKSTLITWIMANLVEKKDDIYVYKFSSDLKNVNWQGENILNDILKTIMFRYDELENKTLIIDGLDEINAGSEKESILNRLNQELAEINILKNFSLIITCRENYVCELKKIECDFITLQIWNDYQIISFCEIYGKKSTCTVPQSKISKILENKEFFGIPLILYMVLALNIAIEKSASLIDIYDQIFSLDRSSIYDRCIENSRYGQEHRISKFNIKQQIHQISQRIAFWIFENNPEKEIITPKNYEKICDDVISENSDGNEDIKKDFLIGNYFKFINHCDGMETQELQFVHRSIYEYFVVVYFFESIHKLESKEKVAGKLGELLKDGHLSKQMLEFIKYKFDGMEGKNLSNIIRDIFNMMLQDGMTYYYIKEQKEPLLDIFVREKNILSNMLEIIRLWQTKLEYIDKKIVVYMQQNHINKLNLGGVNLVKEDLRGANLRGANLGGADLRGADLRGADLRGANLRGANLRGANLSEANLIGADLSEANLIGINLLFANLVNACLSLADLKRANMMMANLELAYLIGADLGEANLGGSNFMSAYLEEANLSGASLSVVNLNKASLRDAIFDEEQVEKIHKKYDLSCSKVHLSGIDKIVKYKEYLESSNSRI